MPTPGYVAVTLCLALLLTGCAQLTTTVIDQLQPTPTASDALAGPVPAGETRVEVKQYFRKKYERLKAFLRKAIDRKECIECSL